MIMRLIVGGRVLHDELLALDSNPLNHLLNLRDAFIEISIQSACCAIADSFFGFDCRRRCHYYSISRHHRFRRRCRQRNLNCFSAVINNSLSKYSELHFFSYLHPVRTAIIVDRDSIIHEICEEEFLFFIRPSLLLVITASRHVEVYLSLVLLALQDSLNELLESSCKCVGTRIVLVDIRDYNPREKGM